MCFLMVCVLENWSNRFMIIPDFCPHRPYFWVPNLHVYSLCFKILLKLNPVYYRYRIYFLPQKLNFFVK